MGESVISEEDIVYSLTKKPFQQRLFAEKLQLVLNGKPKPDLASLKAQHTEKSRTYTRNFNSNNNYGKYIWLTGSRYLNKLFCWPCLLFSNDRNSCWAATGFNSLNYLITACNKHQNSVNHIKAFTSLQTFIVTHSIDHARDYDSIEKDRENRAILKRLIDVVIFFGKQEYPAFFRGHDESDFQKGKGMYVELLQFLSDYDPILANYLKTTTTVFRGKSLSIQNDLIDSVGNVLYDQIKLEISETPFVAILLDETTDVPNISRLSTIVRYVDKHGVCQERFVHFKYVDVSEDRSAEGRYKIVKEIITELSCAEKVIADSFDGAAVMGEHFRGLQNLIKSEYPMATFVNSYAHTLNLVLSKCTLHIKACQRFFITLPGLSLFFSHSTNTTKALQTFMDKKHPGVAPNRWNFTSRLVNTIRDYRTQLIDFFLSIEEEPGDWTSDEVIKAVGFICFLSKVETKFLLNLFNCILLVSNKLSDILQCNTLDLCICTRKVNDFYDFLQKLRNSGFDKVWEESSIAEAESVSLDTVLSSRNEIASSNNKQTYSQLYFEILDTLMYQIKFRFESQSQIQFIKLLDSRRFFEFSSKFPEDLILNLVQIYSKHFDVVRLKNELKVFYSLDELKNKSLTELISFMKTYNLDVVYEQVYKLTQLVLTLPSTVASSEKSFSALKRIRDYLRSTKSRSRPSNLAILSIEKELLMKMKKIQEEFYSNVTENITNKVRRYAQIYWK